MENKLVSKFLEILEDQMIFEFTGRVNILQKNSGQLLGIILFKEGEIIYSKYNNIFGIKGLYALIIEDILQHNFKFVVEPEIIDGTQSNIFEKQKNLSQNFKKIIEKTLESQKYKPPANLKLSINKEFIFKGDDITHEEFDVLCLISDFNKVEEIYKQSLLLDYQITSILVSLRRKKAVLVLNP